MNQSGRRHHPRAVARALRIRIGMHVAPPRFVLFLVLLPLGAWAWHGLLPARGWQDCLAMGFDFAAAVTLAALFPLLRWTRIEDMRRRAAENEANRGLVLVLTSVLTLVVMAAITGELKGAHGGHVLAVVKLVVTLLLIWLFANSVYALHYAHDYYARGSDGEDRRGLVFPDTDFPSYLDFAYFAFTMGMAFATSDVQITARPLRAVALLHCFAAFLFNIGVIAFTINALAGG